jgi:hypothetical protein
MSIKKFTFFVCCLLAISCSKTNTSKKTAAATTPPTTNLPDPIVVEPTVPKGTTTQDDLGVGDSPIPYYRLNDPPIIVHGQTTANNVAWSTKSYLPKNLPRAALSTDDYLAVRIKALAGPAKGTASSIGNTCQFLPVGYKQIRVTVRVVGKGTNAASFSQTFTANVDDYSDIHEFQVPTGSGFDFEVLKPEWDHSCTYAKLNGSWYDNVESPECPLGAVWARDCIAFELQFATSGSKKFN